MFNIEYTAKELLPDVAACHMQCFPQSLATKLGARYVQKTMEWFLVNPNRFLFHVKAENKVIGYCGGFSPSKRGDGSSSGMLQHAFNYAVRGIALKPWLIIHPEVRQHYPFIWRNIKRKITGTVPPAATNEKPFNQYVGLVVIGVDPQFRGKGIAQQLLAEIELKVRQFNQNQLILSVKKDNIRAIHAYQKFGWDILEEEEKTYVMQKLI